MSQFWHLPGPKAFVGSIIGDLRDGLHPILLLPRYGPQEHGLLSALKEAWVDEGHWETVYTKEVNPTVMLADRCEMPGESRVSLKMLSEHTRLAGRTFLLEELTERNWPAWKLFLEDFQHITRSQSVCLRALFIVPLIGELALDPPQEDLGLSLRRWDNVVDDLDLLLYASQLLRSSSHPLQLQRLLASMIAELAAYDPEVVRRLCFESPTTIFQPNEVLLDLLKDRKWDWTIPGSWESGTLMTVLGRTTVHSAVQAAKGELTERLWRAQLSVVFPLVERQRQRLLGLLNGKLVFPINAPGGRIDSLSDVELGHLAHYDNVRGLPIDLRDRELLHELVEIRNHLAHLKTVPLGKLRSICN